MQRRDSLKLMALAPFATGFTWTPRDVEDARRRMGDGPRRGDDPFNPSFFTEHELETVRVLVDLLLPADERSGSATDLGVPEFMDFMMIDRPAMQVPLRGGLAWMDYQSLRRFGAAFAAATDAQRRALLDDIAWPEAAPPELRQGVAFFNSFRDLTATGFWTTQTGIEDLKYLGNTYVAEWAGCSAEALAHLGVRYEDGAAPSGEDGSSQGPPTPEQHDHR
jgi:hypothetical protein